MRSKVAGLRDTTFAITIDAARIATVECINPAGNRGPGQDAAVTVSGTTGPLPTPRNGEFVFTITLNRRLPLPPTPIRRAPRCPPPARSSAA